MRGQLFANRREPVRCRDTAEMWESLNRTDADSLYDAARYRAVAAAVQRAADPSPTGLHQATEQADKAMHWLHNAVAAGYKNIAHIQKNTDLDALRDRDDFKALLAGLTAKPPTAP